MLNFARDAAVITIICAAAVLLSTSIGNGAAIGIATAAAFNAGRVRKR